MKAATSSVGEPPLVDSSLFYRDPRRFFQELAETENRKLKDATFLTFSDAAAGRKKLTRSIFKSWILLKAIIERHEALIRKRWVKMTIDRRKKILLAAWPDMPMSHKPDLTLFMDVIRVAADNMPRSACLWPYVNVEDLCGPKLLLLFINSRARNQPYIFANSDFEASRLGRSIRVIDEVFLAYHAMIFTGRTSAETYAELICWKDDPDAFEMQRSGRSIGAGDGFIILECQARVYKFLLRCCKGLLAEMPEAVQTGDGAPVQPESETLTRNKPGLASMALNAIEAPYRVPAQIDVPHLISIVQAKLSEAEDHIWAIRQDPKYFASVLKDYKLLDVSDVCYLRAQLHCDPEEPSSGTPPWDCAIHMLVRHAFLNVKVYKTLVDKLHRLEKLTAKYNNHIKPEHSLPDEYTFCLYDLLFHLRLVTAGVVASFRTGFSHSPEAQAYFTQGSGQSKRRFLWAVQGFFDERLRILGPGVVLEQIERLQTDNKEIRKSISPWAAASLSEIAILWHCREQITLFQPWAATFTAGMVDCFGALKKAFRSTSEYTSSLSDFEMINSTGLLGIFVDEGFCYPADKPRTKINVDLMRQAEKRLDEVWSVIDGKLAGMYASSQYIQKLLLVRNPERTLAWDEGHNAKNSGQNDIANKEPSRLVKSFSELHLELEQRTERTIDRNSDQASNKIKAKTRGTPTFPPSQINVEASPALVESQAYFPVDGRALKVFKTIFHTPAAGYQPGEFCWLDFVHALCCVGFVAEKLDGSAWHFKPQRSDIQRSIQFHEPHPGNKLRYLVARRYGRRLTRAYGWHGHMFGLQTDH